MSNLIGKPAVAFDLPDIHGDRRRISEFADRWLLLVFHRHLA